MESDSADDASLETPQYMGTSLYSSDKTTADGWQRARLPASSGAAARLAAEALETGEPASRAEDHTKGNTEKLRFARQTIDELLHSLTKTGVSQDSLQAQTRQLLQFSARGIVSCSSVEDYISFLSNTVFDSTGVGSPEESSTLILDVNTVEDAEDNIETALIVFSHAGAVTTQEDESFLAIYNLNDELCAVPAAYFADEETSLTHSGSKPVDLLLKEFDEVVKAHKQMRFPISINGSGVRGGSVLDQRQNALRLLAGTLVLEEPSLKPVAALGIAAQVVSNACSPILRERMQQDVVQLLAAPTLVTIEEDATVAETVVIHVGSGKHARGWGTYVRFSRLSTFSINTVDEPELSLAKLECEFAQDVVLDAVSANWLEMSGTHHPWIHGKPLRSVCWTAPSLIFDISWAAEAKKDAMGLLSEPQPATRTSLADPVAEGLEQIETQHVNSTAPSSTGVSDMNEISSTDKDADNSQRNLQELFRAVERRRAGEQQSLPMHTPVYSWGKGEYGALGHGLFSDAKLPVPALFGLDLGLVRVKSISCSWFHSAAVSDLGLVYTWGSGNDGALGHGNNTSLTTPQLVEFFGMEHPLAAVSVACGSDVSGAHTLVLTSGRETGEPKEETPLTAFRGPITNRVYAFGAGAGSGTGRSTGSLSPQRVRGAAFDELAAQGICHITAGGSCSAVVCNDGSVFTWGRWANGRLGLGTAPVTKAKKQGGKDKVQQLQLTPRKVLFPTEATKIVSIAAGEQHMLCVDSQGHLWSWGKGDSGQLGNGSAVDAMQPQRLNVNEEVSPNEDTQTVSGADTASTLTAATRDDMETAASMYSDVLPASIRSSQRSTGALATEDVLFVSVATGMSHSMAISADGGLFTWGGRGGAMLGHGDQQQRMAAEEDRNNEEATLFELVQASSLESRQTQTKRPYLFPRRVRALCGSVMGKAGEVLAADGGAAHSVAVTAAGELFVWGSNEDSALGTSQAEVMVPQLANAGSTVCSNVQYDSDGTGLKETATSRDNDEYFYGSNMRTELVFLIACSGWHTHVVTLGSSLGIDLQAAAPPSVRSQPRGFQQHNASTVGTEAGEESLAFHDGASTVSKTAIYATHSNVSGSFDTLLRVESGAVYAHKCVLATRSVQFASMIDDEEVSDRVTELSLPDVPLRVLLVILEFMYTDNLCVPLSPASPDLLVIQFTAEKYGLPRLAALCKAMAASPVAPLLYNEAPADEEDDEPDNTDASLFEILEAPTLLQSITKAFISAEWADTVFIAEGERLPAHRSIICARSEYFAALFQDPSRSLQTAVDTSEDIGEVSATDIVEIEVPDKAWALRRLLCFLYTSSLPDCSPGMLRTTGHQFASDVHLNDLILADKYSIVRMKNSAESMVTINRFNAAKALVVADMVSAPRLRERAVLFLVSHIGQVLDTVSWTNLQISRPDLVGELQDRIRERNRVYLGPASSVKTKAELRLDEEVRKNDDLLEKMTFSWPTLAALFVVGILYMYVSVYNTSFGNVVPALNVIVLLSAILLGMKNLAE